MLAKFHFSSIWHWKPQKWLNKNRGRNIGI